MVEQDWEELTIILKILKPLEEATRYLSASKYPTIISSMRTYMTRKLFIGSSLKPCVDGILLKLKEYNSKEVESKPIYFAATILDPRLKLQYIKERYTNWKILKNTFLSNLVYNTYGEVTSST